MHAQRLKLRSVLRNSTGRRGVWATWRYSSLANTSALRLLIAASTAVITVGSMTLPASFFNRCTACSGLSGC